MISIIIPVLNEARALPTALQRVVQQSEAHEIIVVDGGSDDASREIARRFGCHKILAAPRGRASQMNAGAARASGEWLLFLHADTLLPENALAMIANLSVSTSAGGFRHRFSGKNWGLHLISRLHNFRCRCTRIFYGDQALFIRRALFDKMGGFPDVPILEDILFGERLRNLTDPICLDNPVITDSRKFEQMGVWVSLWRVLSILLRHECGFPITSRKFFTDVR